MKDCILCYFRNPLFWMILFYAWFFQMWYDIFRGAGMVDVSVGSILSLISLFMWRALR